MPYYMVHLSKLRNKYWYISINRSPDFIYIALIFFPHPEYNPQIPHYLYLSSFLFPVPEASELKVALTLSTLKSTPFKMHSRLWFSPVFPPHLFSFFSTISFNFKIFSHYSLNFQGFLIVFVVVFLCFQNFKTLFRHF